VMHDFAGTTYAGESPYSRVNGENDRTAVYGAYTNNTDNFGNYKLFIGERNASSLGFTGKLYGLIVRGALSTLEEVEGVEAYLATKAGVSL